MFRNLVAATLVLAAPALAQDGPSFDCAKAQSEAEQAICADPNLARLDRQLAGRYTAALAAAEGLDTGATEAADNLRAYQRGWIRGRDECWKAGDPGTCLADAYLQRDAELAAQWMLAPSGAPVFWACGGNPANEIVTTLFATERPALRIERGDKTYTAVQSPAASGARFDGAFGRVFWIKGDTATYREADPDGSEIACEQAG